MDDTLSTLPSHILFLFPCTFTQRLAVDSSIADLSRTVIEIGIGPQPFSNLLRELHTKRYSQKMLAYLSRIAHYQERSSSKVKSDKAPRKLHANKKFEPRCIPLFSPFEHPFRYAGVHGSNCLLHDNVEEGGHSPP